jgi:methylthioadenosine nucleosidase (EC 3.2.2.16)
LTGFKISRKLKLNDITKIRRTDMIGIIGAMEEEVSQLIEAMENKEK